VSKASRIVAAMTSDNAPHLIAFAKNHTSRQIDFEAARVGGKSAVPKERVKVVGEDLVHLEISISKAVHDNLMRAQNLVSSKTGRAVGIAEVLGRALSEYVERHDPMCKAERARKREASGSAEAKADETKAQLRPNRVSGSSRRKPLPAKVRHAVALRDGGRCTFRDPSGKRCEQERWLDVHHRVPVHAGGGNDPQNLTTLCGFHHDLVHQKI
jgi:hypothetical protein